MQMNLSKIRKKKEKNQNNNYHNRYPPLHCEYLIPSQVPLPSTVQGNGVESLYVVGG